jgi:peptide/nickel transport system permease protein
MYHHPMVRLVLRRLLLAVPLLLLVATLTFLVVHAAPGSYADALDQPGLPAAARAMVRERFGLDLPFHLQYLRWLDGLARGDLGVSYLYRQPVADVVARALPPTLLLNASSLAIVLGLGLALAVAAVRRPHGRVDRVITVLSLGVYGLPTFWLAGLAVLVLSYLLGWLPPSHMHSVDADRMGTLGRTLDLLRHLILPAACLGVVGAAAAARYLRAALLDVRSSRFILAARARGVPERRILWAHALRPALLPVVTLLGLSLPYLVSGSVVVETVFSWPGMGQVLVEAAAARDVPVIMAATVLGAVAVVLGNLVSDLLYAVVDPRVRGAE